MRALPLLFLWLIGCGGPEAPRDARASAQSLPELSFLQGSWRAEEEGRRTDELWLPVGPDRWLGFARTASSGEGRTLHHELLRLERRQGAVRYVAAPEGQATTAFPLERAAGTAGGSEALFTNPTHDFPGWIRYARVGDELLASIGRTGEEAPAAEWRYRRRPGEPRLIEAGGRACVTAGRLEVELSPCHCAAELFCAGFEAEQGVAVELALIDSGCDACSGVRGGCPLPEGPITEVNGRPLRLEEGCADLTLPVLFAGEP